MESNVGKDHSRIRPLYNPPLFFSFTSFNSLRNEIKHIGTTNSKPPDAEAPKPEEAPATEAPKSEEAPVVKPPKPEEAPAAEAPESTVAPENTEKVNCIYLSGELRCQVEEPSRGSEYVIGIGPAKTGSSALARVLDTHPDMVVGESTRHDHECCGSELYFFVHENDYVKGVGYYREYFEMQSGSALVNEKTPEYSDHPLVPYRVRASLGPDVKLIMTIRDSLEGTASLYMHRRTHNSQKIKGARPPTFVEWTQHKIELYKKYEECAKKVFGKMWLPQPSSKSPRIENWFEATTWQTASMIDHHLYQKCWLPVFRRSGEFDIQMGNDAATHYLYLTNLRRWKHVFGSSNVLCVFHENLTVPSKQSGVFEKVMDFLSLDASKLPEGTLAVPEGSQEKERLSQSAVERLRVFDGAVLDQAEHDSAIELWKDFFKENTMEAIKEMCEH